MKKLLAAALAALIAMTCAAPAAAQVAAYTDATPDGTRITVPVTPDTPLPVTISGGGGGGGGAITAATCAIVDIGCLVSPATGSSNDLLTRILAAAQSPLAAGTAVIGHIIVDTGSAVMGHVILDASSAVIGHVVVDTLPATPAGESHTGEVGGNQITVTAAQTVTASSAYTAGNAVGGLMTLANAERVAGKGGLLQSVVINMKSAQTTQIDVFFFNANPTGSTCTDKTAFVLATADFDKVVGVAHVTDWTAGNVASIGQSQGLAMPYVLPSGTSAYACAITRSTPTFTATSDPSLAFRFIRN